MRACSEARPPRRSSRCRRGSSTPARPRLRGCLAAARRLAAVALALSLAACLDQAPDGLFACRPETTGSCPPGWLCQCRGAPCAWRCYATPGDHCGDGKRDAPEVCDGNDFGGESCVTRGYYAGTLTCAADCSAVSEAGCAGRCGDGEVNGGERCDGADLGGHSCESLGYHGGDLACGADCTDFDRTACARYCGDGVADPEEQCDGLDQRGETCVDYGYAAGALGCNAFCERTFERCLVPGWRPAHSGTAENLFAAWDAPTGEAIAVGAAGTILRDPGGGWTAMTSGTSADLLAVWGSRSDDVFAVGMGGTILRYDGAAWTAMDSGTMRDLRAVWGSAANDVWAVGAWGTVLHYDGSAWAPLDSGTVANLNGVNGRSATELYVVGDNGTVLEIAAGAVAAASVSWPSAARPTLHAVTAGAPADPVAVGAGGVILRRSGGAWTVTAGPTPRDLRTVAGGWAEGALAAGDAGAILRYEGTAWVVARSGGAGLRGLAVRSPTRALAVGLSGTALELDDSGWRVLPTGTDQDLTGVAGRAVDDVYAVGTAGTVLHYDGHAWSPLPGPPEGDDLTALWVAETGELFATSASAAAYVGRCEGGACTWSRDDSIRCWGNAVWGSSGNNVFVVGGWGTSSGCAAHYDGASWVELSVPPLVTGFDLTRVFGLGPATVYVAGWNALIRYDGTSWADLGLDYALQPAGIWGTTPADLLVLGTLGECRHFDGDSWTELPPASSGLSAVWGVGSSAIFAVGEGVHHYDGATWSPMQLEAAGRLNGVRGASSSEVHVVGAGGTALRFRGEVPAPYGGACQRPVDIPCGTTLYGSNARRPARIDSYACGDRPASGAEVFYRFQAPVPGRVTVRLGPREADLDLVVVRASSDGACDLAGGCLAASQSSSTALEEVAIDVAVPGETYYLVADGVDGAVSAFSLRVECPRP